MSEVVVPDANALAIPGTGELVDLTDPLAVSRALSALRVHRGLVRQVEHVLIDRLCEERSAQGVRQLDYDGITVKFGTDTEARYDAEGLEERLRAAGMPESRISQIVVETVEKKVKAVEAKKAARVNPAYAEALELSREIVPKTQRVTVEIAR